LVPNTLIIHNNDKVVIDNPSIVARDSFSKIIAVGKESQHDAG
jgi:actin-like ATPase involved in cell morphogenesis